MAKYSSISPFLATGSQVINFIAQLDSENRDRVARYKENWEFYEGEHWSYPDSRNVTLNYAARIVDIKETFLTKNGFQISIPDLGESGTSEPVDRSFIKNVLDEQWDRNDRELFFIEMAQVGGVVGDIFIRPSVEIDESDGEPYVRLTILPSHFVFPVYGGAQGYDRRKMLECHFIYPLYEESLPIFNLSASSRTAPQQKKIVWYRETWTAETISTYRGDALISVEQNLLGEIGIIHIQNYPNKNDDFGISDLKGIIPLQRVFNEKCTDVSDIIDYYASPVTVAYGVRFDTIERGPDKIWHVNNPDGKIENLKLDDDLNATKDFLDRIYQAILDISGVPHQAMNPTDKISNTPGVAMHMSFMPLVENRNKKILTYGKGIENLNRIILKTYALFDAEFKFKLDKVKYRRYFTKVNFGNPLPRDQSLELDLMQKRLEMGISSRVEELMILGEGEADARRKVKEADEDFKARLEIKAAMQVKNDEKTFGKQTTHPNPVVQGDKVSKQNLK